MQQEIADAADAATRSLLGDDPSISRTNEEITSVMLEAAKLKANTYKGQFSKWLAVAHPALGDEFLAEVKFIIYLSFRIVFQMIYFFTLVH